MLSLAVLLGCQDCLWCFEQVATCDEYSDSRITLQDDFGGVSVADRLGPWSVGDLHVAWPSRELRPIGGFVEVVEIQIEPEADGTIYTASPSSADCPSYVTVPFSGSLVSAGGVLSAHTDTGGGSLSVRADDTIALRFSSQLAPLAPPHADVADADGEIWVHVEGVSAGGPMLGTLNLVEESETRKATRWAGEFSWW
ncbi:MAG: hypothetical protein GY871_03460 [Actinomycetales bacterium]|nr:hypothetical protein [Actinomycetales bacterium]